ncbi:MAG: T9SS type A sorting domain-containing protein [Bacteroidetes bacterium]|nr:T9SS type A sorting domain-containing protein [Bacteroidota bacterium]
MSRLKYMHHVCVILCLFLSNLSIAQFSGNLQTDGSTQCVQSPNAMLNGVTIWTMELWVKTTESRANATYWNRPSLMATVSSGNSSGDFGIITNNGYIGMWSGLNSSGDNDFLSSTVQINNNNWHHIAAVNDGSNIKLYVDGVLAGSISSGLGLFTNGCPLTIGAGSLNFGWGGNGASNTNFWHQGIYDEVRISNNVRYSSNFSVPTAAFIADVNTVALYHLDACVGNGVPDASSNNNAGIALGYYSGNCAVQLPPVPTIGNNPSIGNINKSEYFFDTDPGFGKGTDISVTTGTNITVNNAAVNLVGLSDGVHFFNVRTKNSTGSWGLTNMLPFYILPVIPTIGTSPSLVNINKAEYFIDADPGFGKGTDIPVAAGTNITVTNAAIDLTGLTSGVHFINIRTKDVAGHWSLTNILSFMIIPVVPTIGNNTTLVNINKAEYFIDADPGFGKGADISVTAGTNVTASNAVIDLTGLSNGIHQVYVRTRDANGKWGLTNNQIFNILVAAITIPPNPAAGNLTKFEYFFDTDPGFGKGHTVGIAATTNLNNYSFAADLTGLADGQHTLFMRSYDGWGLTNTQSFTIGAIVPLSWLSFNAHKVADSVLLNWQTTNEVNVSKMIIERSSDGISFKQVGEMRAKNTVNINDYHFADNQPLQGINYYRIKQIDMDGQYKYSVIVSIVFNKTNAGFIAYPSPANNEVNILINNTLQHNARVKLFSVKGQLLMAVQLRNMLTNISTQNIANGTYILGVENGPVVQTQKIIVQH